MGEKQSFSMISMFWGGVMSHVKLEAEGENVGNPCLAYRDLYLFPSLLYVWSVISLSSLFTSIPPLVYLFLSIHILYDSIPLYTHYYT